MKKIQLKPAWKIRLHYFVVVTWSINIGIGLSILMAEPVLGWLAYFMGGMVIAISLYFVAKEVSKWTTTWAVSSK